MKCKFCSAELPEETTLCPECGKTLTEEETAATPTQVKQSSRELRIVLSAIALTLLAIVLTGAVLHYTGVINVKQMFGGGPAEGTSATVNETQGNTVPTVPVPTVTYTAANTTVEQNGSQVVAKVGNQELTVSELQIHYWSAVHNFISYYGGYVQQFTGLDPNTALDLQIYDKTTGQTYQQWFLENALKSWRRYATLVQMAEDAGYQMTAEQQSELDNMAETVKKQAQEEGFSDAEAYIDTYYPGSSLEGFVRYNTIVLKAMYYFDALYDTMMPTQAEMEDYYTKNEEDFKKNKLSKEDGLYYDVRHILIPVEGEVGDVNGVPTYSEEQWSACLAKAQKVLDDFAADNGTEEDFARLAKELSADPGSASEGGLYTNLTKDTSFIEPFKNWYLEEGRKPGDTGLVKNTQSSTQGYHIMYFCGTVPIWEHETKTAILSERTTAMLTEAETQWPMTTNYENVVLGQVENTK